MTEFEQAYRDLTPSREELDRQALHCENCGGRWPTAEEVRVHRFDAPAGICWARDPACLASAAQKLPKVVEQREELAKEIDRTWAVLGTDPAECADDPDVATLDRAVAVSLQHERDKVDQVREQLELERKVLLEDCAALGAREAVLVQALRLYPQHAKAWVDAMSETSQRQAQRGAEQVRAIEAQLDAAQAATSDQAKALLELVEAVRAYLPSQEAAIKHARAPQTLINVAKALRRLDVTRGRQ